MQELLLEVKRTLFYITVWGALVIAAMYYAGQSYLISGFIFGIICSMVYYLLMSYRVKKSIELPVAKAVSSMRTGWLIRLSFIVLMLVLAAKLQQINLWSAVAGLFSLHAVLLFNAVVYIIRGIARQCMISRKE